MKRFGIGICWQEMPLGEHACILEYKIASEVSEAEQY